MSDLINRFARLPGERRGDFLARLRSAATKSKDVNLGPRSRPAPLSFAQASLWVLDRLSPGQPTYNVPTAYWLDGPLATDALTRALLAFVNRHEVLRTRVRDTPDGPIQD